MQKDEVFGNISWERDVWVTTASIPYFIGSGERVYMPQEDRQSLPSAIKLPLKIETGGVRRGPWTGSDGIGVRWRDGEVEAIGHPSVADPDRFQ